MAQYVFAFDLDTEQMHNDGYNIREITSVYQTELPDALTRCGFTAHPQDSIYHTENDRDPVAVIMQLQNTLRAHAPQFCLYVRRVHVFRTDEWSDVTLLIANRPATDNPDSEEELEEEPPIP